MSTPHSLPRRTFLRAGAAATAGLALTGAQPQPAHGAPSQRPPNLLFVLADQWRFSAFSHETDPLVRTPHFDKFVEQGARWRRCYAANPVCSPNRSCIITGRFAHQHGMTNNDRMLPPSERCIAEWYQQAGYATHYIGKWHMDGTEKPGFVPPGWRRRGFATFEGFNRGHSYYASPTFSNEGEPLSVEGYEPTWQTDRAIEYMRAQRDKPFFCYLSWGPPHTPYKPPREFDKYDPAQLKWRPNVPESVRNDPKIQREMAGYFGLCESLDHEWGRLMKALDESGLAENTLVVFTADHGDLHGSHNLYRKGKPEDESLHIPLFMRLPGKIRAGQMPDTLVSSIDLMPTMSTLCGLAAPGTCTGRDVSAAVLGGDVPQVESIYAQGSMARELAEVPRKRRAARPQASSEWRAVVTPEHKLAVSAAGEVKMLIDLARDPYEMNNLAGQKGQQALEKEMLRRLNQWAEATDDPFPKISPTAEVMYSDAEAAAARS